MQPGVKLASSLVLTCECKLKRLASEIRLLLTSIKIGDKLFNLSIHDNCISWHFFHVLLILAYKVNHIPSKVTARIVLILSH